jgi:hypothetical protein
MNTVSWWTANGCSLPTPRLTRPTHMADATPWSSCNRASTR